MIGVAFVGESGVAAGAIGELDVSVRQFTSYRLQLLTRKAGRADAHTQEREKGRGSESNINCKIESSQHLSSLVINARAPEVCLKKASASSVSSLRQACGK